MSKFTAFYGGKKINIEADDLWSAKQSAITTLKVPKSKVGLLAVVSDKSLEAGDFQFESEESALEYELSERHQIKRKWGPYESKKINSVAPIRDSAILFVGKRFVTEEELKHHLSKILEQRGSANGVNWYKNNQKYFESTVNRGQNVITLSKYGKRVLEFVNTNKLNEDNSVDEGFNFLLKSNNTAAREIAKSIQKQKSYVSERAMGELLDLINKDFNESGYSVLDTYIK